MSAFAALARRHLWLPPLLVLIVLGAAIGVMRPSTFAMDQINIKIAAAMTLTLIATGETIVVTRGGIDLSIGGILSLTTAICATTFTTMQSRQKPTKRSSVLPFCPGGRLRKR